MNPDVYRGIWGGNMCRDSSVQTDRQCSCDETCQAGLKYVEQFRQEMAYNVPKNGLAGFWAETIQGVGGVVQFPKNYIKRVRDVVKEAGGLFVADEVNITFLEIFNHFHLYSARYKLVLEGLVIISGDSKCMISFQI